MMGIASRGVAIIGSVIVLLGAAQPVAARERRVARPDIASARFGLVSAKVPRLGVAIVRRDGYTALNDMIRPRFYRGMTDIYPSATIGFRFSIGSRYFARPNVWARAEQATRGILYDPHWRTGGGVPSGFRRRTWAMTAGYDTEIVPGLIAGIEGGALNGRAINPGPRGRSFRADDRNANRAGINPIATVAIRYAF